jgi:hypothetical protein
MDTLQATKGSLAESSELLIHLNGVPVYGQTLIRHTYHNGSVWAIASMRGLGQDETIISLMISPTIRSGYCGIAAIID